MDKTTTSEEQAIERAMARIGCPPGDNSDADLYRELGAALASLKSLDRREVVAWMCSAGYNGCVSAKHKEEMRALVGDAFADKFDVPLVRQYTQPSDPRLSVEAELSRLRAELDEALGALKKCRDVIHRFDSFGSIGERAMKESVAAADAILSKEGQVTEQSNN